MYPSLSFGTPGLDQTGGFPNAFQLGSLASGGGGMPAPMTLPTPAASAAPAAAGPTAAAPGATDTPGWLGSLGGLDGLKAITQGLGSLGQLYLGLKSLGFAKDQLGFQRDAYNTNLRNQTMSYNTALEDRARARYAMENQPASAADSYIAAHKL